MLHRTKIGFNEASDRPCWVWEPGEPGRKLPAQLMLRPDRYATLRVLGEIGSGSDDELDPDIIPALVGWTDDGAERLTFVRLLRGNAFGVNDAVGFDCMPRWVLVGHHLGNDALESVDALRIRWQAGERWLGTTPAVRRWHREATSPADEELTINFGSLASLGGARLRLDLSFLRRSGSARTELTHTVHWVLRFEQPVPILEAERHARRLRDLLSLFVGVPVPAVEVVLEVDEHHVFLANSAACGPLDVRARERHAREMLVPFSSGVSLGALVDRWFETAPGWPGAWIGVLPPDRGPIERLLLDTMQLFDTVLLRGRLTDPNTFRPVRDRMEAAVPSDAPDALANGLRRRIREANQMSFQDRIAVAVERMPPLLRGSFGIDGSLPPALVRARNRIVHSGPDSAGAVPDLVFMHTRARAVLVYYVLAELGVPETELIRGFERCHALHPPVSVATN